MSHRPINELLDLADRKLDITYSRGILLSLLCMLLCVVLPALVHYVLQRCNHLETNFRGNKIPNSFGIVFLLITVPCISLARYTYLPGWKDAPLWSCGIIGFGILGLIDDVLGDKSIKGIRGHIMALLTKGKVTTGLVKFVGGGLLSLWLAKQHEVVLGVRMVESTLIIALCSNAMNLLDLRPGRACGAFLLTSGSLIGYWVVHGDNELIPLLLIFIPACRVWLLDSQVKCMLGDAGSNLLGAALGIGIVFSPCTDLWRHGTFVALILFHILTERYSLSKLIAANPILRFTDSLFGERE